jgi:hypothetical protein
MTRETYSARSALNLALSRLRAPAPDATYEAPVLALMAKAMGSVLDTQKTSRIEKLGNVQGAASLLSAFETAITASDQGKADDFVEFMARFLELDVTNIAETQETRFVIQFTLPAAAGEETETWPDNWVRIQSMADTLCGNLRPIDGNSLSAAVYLLGEPKEQKDLLATKVLENRLIVLGNMKTPPVEAFRTAIGETAAYLGGIDVVAYRYFVDVCRAAETDKTKRADYFNNRSKEVKDAIFASAAPFCLYPERLKRAMDGVEHAYKKVLPAPDEFRRATTGRARIDIIKAAEFAEAAEITYLNSI